MVTKKKWEIGYLIEWTDYDSPKLLNQILSKNLRIRATKQPLTSNGKTFLTVVLSFRSKIKKWILDAIYNYLNTVISDYTIEISGVETGFTEGINLGNPNFVTLSQPKVAIVVGQGVDASDAGEIWHVFDQKAMPLTKINIEQLQNIDLSRYTTLILSNGNYSRFSNKAISKIEQWIQNGGTLIAYQDAIKWLNDSKFIDLTFKTVKNEAKKVSFQQADDYRGAQIIAGAIFETKLDLSHPINFGMPRNTMPIFRNTL